LGIGFSKYGKMDVYVEKGKAVLTISEEILKIFEFRIFIFPVFNAIYKYDGSSN
jgi:hypothetical protein